MKIKDGFLFFWGNEDYMSNWYKVSFELNGITFNCSEQYMMYSKAMVFGDTYHAQKILETNSQAKQKGFGRQVRNYDDKIWSEVRIDVVFEGIMAKFKQNENLKEQLLSTGDLHLVEASPYDQIWGIGMDEDDPDATNPEKWDGLNLLGEVLMVVREHLRQE